VRSIESLALVACLVGSLIWVGAAHTGNSEAETGTPLTGTGVVRPGELAPILVPTSIGSLLAPSSDHAVARDLPERSRGDAVPTPVSPPASPLAAASPSSAAGWTVSAPAIGLDATITPFGLTGDGMMEVPADGRTVAWYRFTAVPGAAGNAVLAAHVDWAGAPGAFHQLRHARPGDLVQVTSPEGASVTYRVDTVELVEARVADIAGIVGGRDGRSTLTLITCGGPFNRAIGAYEHRVIVRASLVPSVPPSDA